MDDAQPKGNTVPTDNPERPASDPPLIVRSTTAAVAPGTL